MRVSVGVRVGVRLGVSVRVAVGVRVGVAVAVKVRVVVGDEVALGVGVMVALGVGDAVAVWVGVMTRIDPSLPPAVRGFPLGSLAASPRLSSGWPPGVASGAMSTVHAKSTWPLGLISAGTKSMRTETWLQFTPGVHPGGASTRMGGTNEICG